MLQGSLVAVVTPMLGTGAVDWAALDRLTDIHIEQGTHGIVPTGTTGESATLEVTEHLKVITHVVKRVAGRVPVVAGTGANSTKEAIELTRMAADAGSDVCLLVTPYYNKPTQEGLYRHYLAVADAVNIPQLLYNVPGRTACDLLPETICKLSNHPGIVGVKEATGDVSRVGAILQHAATGFYVLSGEDAKNMELMQAGAVGCISVTANAAPRLMSEFCAAMLAGDIVKAQQCHEQLSPLHEALFVESSPIPVKWALHRLGWIEEGIRLPLTPLATDKHAVVEEGLKIAGMLDP